MTSVVVAVLVVTLLLPGLALLFAVVVRYLFHGPPRPGEPQDASHAPGTEVDEAADCNGHADTLH